jgi:predicted nuclease with TOPRIM domain
MKNIVFFPFLCLLLVPQGCDVKGETSRYTIEELEQDTVDDMIEFINYIDTAHLVEDVKDNYTKMEKKNEELKNELEETKYELEIVQEKLESAEEFIKTNIPSDTIYSDYMLLPISKENGN